MRALFLKILTVGFFLVCHEFSNAQSLKAVIKDAETQMPIPDAIITIENEQKAVYSQSDGSFNIIITKLPSLLKISHISYKIKEIKLSDFDSVNFTEIFLIPENYYLKPVEINVKLPSEVMSNRHFYLIDYEFSEDDIVVLALENGSNFRHVLILINSEGDTLSKVDVYKSSGFYKDFEGNIFLFSGNNVMHVICLNHKLYLEYEMEYSEFQKVYPYIVANNKPFWYLKREGYKKQVVDYFTFNENTEEYTNFYCAIDQQAIQRSRWGQYFDGTEADEHFAEAIINRPVYAPMFRINDSLVIFDYINNVLKVFNSRGELLSTLKLEFTHNRKFNENIMLDEVTGKFYVSYLTSGLTSIYEININTGNIEEVVYIPDFVFVEKVKVNNGNIYFLYKEKYRSEFKRLYRLPV